MSAVATTGSFAVGRKTGFTLPPAAAFWGTAVAFAAFFLAAGAPTALLVVDEKAWGFAPWVMSVAFGVYAFGLLAALLVAGALSDHIGRRPVLIGALSLELAAMLTFLLAGDIAWVIAARVLQGLATGLATSAFTAAIVEQAPESRKRLGTLVGSVAPAGGLGLGALLAGGAAGMLASPNAVVWSALAAVMAGGVVVAVLSRETADRAPGALRSLVPSISIPAGARRTYAAIAPSLAGAWMLAALFLGLMPSILRFVFGIDDPLVSGATAFVEPAAAAVAVVLLSRMKPARMLTVGGFAVVVGALVVVGSVVTVSLPLLLLGGVIGGVGFGATLAGSLRSASAVVATHERAGMFAAVYLVAYLAFGVPAIIAGALIAPVGLGPVAVVFGSVVAIAAVIGLAVQAAVRRSEGRLR